MDSLEKGVRIGNVLQVRREFFADLVGEGANDGPDGVIRILRLQGQVEAHKLFYRALPV